jgi:type I restriction enzyme S subunit
MENNPFIFGECANEVRDKVQPEGANGAKYIGLEHIEQGTLHLNGFGSANDVSSTKSKFSKGDILFGKLRPYFRKVVRAPFDGVCSTDIWVVRSTNGIDQGFLYYWMASQEFVDFSMQGSEGTKMPRAKWNHVSRHKVPFFTDDEQKAIAHILGSLDDKIELNRRMNETLEAMAQALFKSWFVDFDPVIDNALAAGNEIPEELKERADIREALGDARKPLPEEIQNLFPSEFEHTGEMGWIPMGWTTQPLYEIANFINGAAYKNFHFTDEPGALPVVKIAEIKNGVSAQTKFTKTELADKYRIDDGDILFSWSGNPDTSIDTFVWTGGPGWLNQHIFNVSLNDDADRNFVYYQLKLLRPDFAEIARNKQTTGLGHVTAQDMKRMHVTKCPYSILQAFNTYAGSLFDRWYSNLLAIKNKSKLRDSLLPQLLSGEMRIPEAEKLVEGLQ